MSYTAKTALPPGPRLPMVVQSALMAGYGLRFLSGCQRRYGNVFTLRIPLSGTVVYLADPADIKTVYAGDPRVFHSGEAHWFFRGLLGDSSLFVLDEDAHHTLRRLTMPAFHRDVVANQAAQMAAIAAANIAGWPVGKGFPIAPKTTEITLEVILRTVIGASDPARLAALRKVVPRLLYMKPWETPAITKPSLRRHRPWRGVRRRFAETDALLYAEIADRRADPNLAERTDVLAMLVRAADDDGRTMSDSELRDQLLTAIAAGHETTATALSWALERLTRHPAALAKAVRAADASAAGDPAGDEYLDAVIKETLRIRPVLFSSGRVLKEPTEVGGYLLPAGVMVDPAIGLVHASAAVYQDPDRFDPDRMLGATLSPTTWLPFGGGNRRCLGATFAMIEIRLVLREILRRVELSTTTAADEKQRAKHVTFVPHRGGLIHVRAIRDTTPTSQTAMTPHCPANVHGSRDS
ncbi:MULTISPECIES: cytochrome P450 [unclassified Mycolicibacterium]|uniref:cytochrome P450 n=1 Tax=unclassified Mycolicibacterium TaxID=2636767 RepID=UPI0013078139|nr:MULTISPECIES: cytochrome P450 [unclassified Mycolicibacterium]MUL84662.1 cytochrome P450 [Mycolicibacterium sp. CBMA 329]MUL88437.1 cytochrome P450 [Mycolicibacterium sp. CBMA 331]MUM03178.1 cytochrome P450 [Mycolicibacterium sp. CBMA 334]MUM40084.1 cytochrome P450 [Mycolicibacterium sp. CBMA 247]MUM44502.1 cytochrome P450 [Mycolicibacterium sp. CBMA 294]